MVQEPSHVKQLSPIHVCKIGLNVKGSVSDQNPNVLGILDSDPDSRSGSEFVIIFY
jgi:hypothetical protein